MTSNQRRALDIYASRIGQRNYARSYVKKLHAEGDYDSAAWAIRLDKRLRREDRVSLSKMYQGTEA